MKDLPVVIIACDSIGVGTGDAPVDLGHAQKALKAAGVLFIDVARSGETAQGFATYALSPIRVALAGGGTHAYSNFGTNDVVQSGASTAIVQASLLKCWSIFLTRGVKVWQSTIVPRSTSTDSWMSTGNQTPVAGNAFRVPVNNWMRAGAPIDPITKAAVAIGTAGALLAGSAGHPLAGYFELADIVESARDSGLWTVSTVAVASAVLAANVVTLTTAAPHGLLTSDTAKISGVDATIDTPAAGSLVTVTGATTFTYAKTAANGSFGAGGTVTIPNTIDGIHPVPHGHTALAGGINTGVFT